MLKARIERVERRLSAGGGRPRRFEIVYSNGEHAYFVDAGERRRAVFVMPRPGEARTYGAKGSEK